LINVTDCNSKELLNEVAPPLLPTAEALDTLDTLDEATLNEVVNNLLLIDASSRDVMFDPPLPADDNTCNRGATT
jgi:hypothetical protein